MLQVRLRPANRFAAPLAMVAALAGCSHLALACEVTVYGNSERAPKSYLKDGRATGILVDQLRYIDQRIACQVTVELYPWELVQRKVLASGGGITGFSRNERRERHFVYTKPVFLDELRLLVKAGSEFPYEGYEDLDGRTLVIDRSISFGQDFEDAVAAGRFTVVRESRIGERLRMVTDGEVDAMFVPSGEAGLRYLLSELRIPEAERDRWTLLAKPFKINPNHIAFRKGPDSRQLVEQFNAAIDEGIESGAFAAIFERYRATTSPDAQQGAGNLSPR